MNKTHNSKIGILLGIASLGVLTGCIGYVDGPRARIYAPPPPSVYVETEVVVQDDYVYYPDYQVYYSDHRRQYIYLEGRSWVTRPSPPRVSIDVLFASPSVRLDFHDSPAVHHSAVVRQYPNHWKSSESNHDNNQGRDDGRDDGKHKGGKGRD
jgi:hypothetical protein